MNKKKKTLLGGLVVIVVLALAIVALMLTEDSSSKDQDTTSTESTVTSTVDTSAVLWYKTDGVETLTIENEKGGYQIDRTSTGGYEIEELRGFEQFEEGYSTVTGIYSYFYAYMTVEEKATNFEQYGLEDPTATIHVAFPDGEEHTVEIGNLIIGSEGYYCRVDGTDAVYGVDLSYLYGMTLTPYDFVDPEVIEVWVAPEVEEDEEPITAPTISNMSVQGANFGEDTLVIEKSDELNLAVTYAGLNIQYDIVSPIEASYRLYYIQDAEVQDPSYRMIFSFHQLTAYSVETINPTDDQLQEYGLAEPYAVVSFNRDGEDHVWTIGNQTQTTGGEKARYLMADDKQIVYIVLESDLPWIEAEWNDVVSSILLYPSITEVSSVDVTFGGKTHTLKHTLDDEKKNVVTASIDNTDIENVTYYRNLYQYIMSVAVSEVNLEGKSSDKLAARIVYHYADGRADDVIELFDIGDRRCVLSLNGNESFITKSSFVTTLENNFQKVLSGEKPTMEW